MCRLTLSEIMTRNVQCLEPDAKLSQVISNLHTNRHSCAVIAGKKRVPLGIITERDCVSLMATASDPAEVLQQTVSEHMTSPPFTLPENTPLDQALSWVNHRKLKHVLVTNVEGEVLGIITQSDLVAAYSRIMKAHSDELERTVSERTAELANANRKLVSLSMIDPLTGMGNRRALEIDVTRIHAAGIRQRRPYSIAIFDLDYFKNYNDHYGHQAGDSILELVGSHLRSAIRESDSVYRYGGEEFLLLMPDTHAEAGSITVHRIVKRLYELQLPHVESPLEVISISAGLAASHHQGQRLANWRQVLELADEALYEAKAKGRNQYQISAKEQLQVVN